MQFQGQNINPKSCRDFEDLHICLHFGEILASYTANVPKIWFD